MSLTNQIFWLTGLSGSGKTTIASKFTRNKGIVHLDADIFRKYVTPDLGFDIQSRFKNVKEAAKTAVFLNKLLNAPVICCFTSPSELSRRRAQTIIEINGIKFHLIYIKCSIEECIKRDPKRLYSEGLKNMVGIDIKYQEPKNPDLIIDTENYSMDFCINQLSRYYYSQ